MLSGTALLTACYGPASPKTCHAKYMKPHGLFHQRPNEAKYDRCMAEYYRRKHDLARAMEGRPADEERRESKFNKALAVAQAAALVRATNNGSPIYYVPTQPQTVVIEQAAPEPTPAYRPYQPANLPEGSFCGAHIDCAPNLLCGRRSEAGVNKCIPFPTQVPCARTPELEAPELEAP